jgi:hypothetical protein
MNPVITQAELNHVPGCTLAQFRDACWFADVWAEHCRPGMHLRDIHYKLQSIGTVVMAPGVRQHEGRGRPAVDAVLDAICLAYENDKFCWLVLQRSAKAARYWRLVDARDFEEHRSPQPKINVTARETPSPNVVLPATWPKTGFPIPEVIGYDYDPADQPIAVEVWCEKSTMDHILIPLCRELRINYQPLTGFFSVTRAVEMLCRSQKPTHVIYISDLDAAGCYMPEAFAEALAHYQPIYAPHIDIRLKQLALTEAQVLDYRLPRNIIDKEKESDYNKRFRAEHPLGPCELDALEAIRPGVLAQLVRDAVAPYFDKTLSRRLTAAEMDAQQRVDASWDTQTTDARESLATLQADMDAIIERQDEELAPLEQQIEAIRARYDVEFIPLVKKRNDVRQAVLDQTVDIELPERPAPAVTVPDDDWLLQIEAAS